MRTLDDSVEMTGREMFESRFQDMPCLAGSNRADKRAR